jgi:hypothetical protein
MKLRITSDPTVPPYSSTMTTPGAPLPPARADWLAPLIAPEPPEP